MTCENERQEFINADEALTQSINNREIATQQANDAAADLIAAQEANDIAQAELEAAEQLVSENAISADERYSAYIRCVNGQTALPPPSRLR